MSEENNEAPKPATFDASDSRFREAFEAAAKAMNMPLTRLGDGYRSSYTQRSFEMAFSTVNRLGLYQSPPAEHVPISDDRLDEIADQYAVDYVEQADIGFTIWNLNRYVRAVLKESAK